MQWILFTTHVWKEKKSLDLFLSPALLLLFLETAPMLLLLLLLSLAVMFIKQQNCDDGFPPSMNRYARSSYAIPSVFVETKDEDE